MADIESARVQYKDVLMTYYLENPTVAVADSENKYMKDCGYENFAEEVENIRRLQLNPKAPGDGCRKKYKEVVNKYLTKSNLNTVVSPEDVESMEKCGYYNFAGEVNLQRQLAGNRLPSSRVRDRVGGRKSRKRSNKIKKRRRRTHTRF